MAPIRLNSKRSWIVIIILLVIIIILSLLLNQCNNIPIVDSKENAAKEDFTGEIENINTLNPGNYAENSLPDTECSQSAELYIADGPGNPQEKIVQTGWLPSDNKNNDIGIGVPLLSA